MAEPLAEPAAEPGEQEDAIQVILPAAGHLASSWEHNPLVRQQMRDGKKLLAWTSRVTIGAANQASLVLNRTVIMILIDVWGGVCQEPKSVPIRWVRDEVWGIQFSHPFGVPCVQVCDLNLDLSKPEGEAAARHVLTAARPG